GSPAALLLARAGVGRLGLLDFDVVDVTNLHRQVLHTRPGERKVASAAARLRQLAPEVALELHDTRLDASNALELFRRYDVVLDGSDGFPTRFLCNDAALLAGVPLVHGAVVRLEGQLTTVAPGRGPCLRCLFEAPPAPGEIPTCAQAGILGSAAGVVGSLMAAEALKVLRGEPGLLIGRMLVWDARRGRMREVAFRRDPACRACAGERPLRLDPADDAEGPCAA
ncbi:MAG: HesA/MoeB/ThiF family protein, partial [Myxococcales bacterium]